MLLHEPFIITFYHFIVKLIALFAPLINVLNYSS